MRRTRVPMIVAMICASFALHSMPSTAVMTPWSGTASLSVSTLSYSSSQTAPTFTATASPTLTDGYYLSVYNDTQQLVCSATYSGTCTGSAYAPMNGSRSYTAYVAYGTPPNSGPPTNDVRAQSTDFHCINLTIPRRRVLLIRLQRRPTTHVQHQLLELVYRIGVRSDERVP